MKRLLSIALCVGLVLGLSSCAYRDTECEQCEEEYFDGLSNGQATVFMELYNSVPNKKLLYRDTTWSEKDFFSLHFFCLTHECTRILKKEI